jgi:hypothetical protein
MKDIYSPEDKTVLREWRDFVREAYGEDTPAYENICHLCDKFGSLYRIDDAREFMAYLIGIQVGTLNDAMKWDYYSGE